MEASLGVWLEEGHTIISAPATYNLMKTKTNYVKNSREGEIKMNKTLQVFPQ